MYSIATVQMMSDLMYFGNEQMIKYFSDSSVPAKYLSIHKRYDLNTCPEC